MGEFDREEWIDDGTGKSSNMRDVLSSGELGGCYDLTGLWTLDSDMC